MPQLTDKGLSYALLQSAKKVVKDPNKFIGLLPNKEINKIVKKTIDDKDIAIIVCSYFNMELELVYNKTRKREIVTTRQLIHYFIQ